MPIEMELLGHFLDGGLSAASADEIGEAFGIQGIVGKPFQPLVLHTATLGALHSSQPQKQKHAFVATGEIADMPGSLIVIAVIGATANAANRFFSRRCKEITTASGSPKRPRIVARGVKPGNR